MHRLALPLLALVAGSVAAAEERALYDLPFEDLLQIEIRAAGKRDDEIRDIPASVTILTREEIARYGWATFEELLRNVPGFFVLDNLEDRFIGNRGTVGGGVQFLINGVAQHPSRQKALTVPEIARLNIPVESIDRVEIIRGPMSVIYGNNAFLGVINVVTNAIGEHGSRVSASVGSRDSGRVFARVGTASTDGFVVLNAGAHRTDGLDGAYRHMMGAAQQATLAPGMHESLDGYADQRDLSADLSAGWGGWRLDLRYTQKDYGFYAFTPGFDDGNRQRLTTWHAALDWEHAFSETLGLRASLIGSEESADIDTVDFLSPSLDGLQSQRSRRWDTELDLLWNPHPTLDLLAGYRFRWVDGLENLAAIDTLLNTTNRVEDLGLHDLFAELGWNAGRRLRLIGGLRLSRLPESYRYTSEDRLDDTLTEHEIPVEDRHLLTGRVAALWSLDRHQVLKLIWGTAAQDSDQIQFSAPERIATTELVYVRTRPTWTLSASLFRNRISNIVRTIQVIDTRSNSYRSIDDNSGEWLTHGLELTGEWRPTPAFGLDLSVTWQDTEDRRTGIEPGYSPHLLFKLKTDYRHGPLTYALFAHYVGPMESDWSFVDGATAGVVERIGERVDGYWNLGANLRYRHPLNGLRLDLHVSNLLDSEIRYPANELTDFTRGLIGPGRVVTLTLGWEF